MSSQTQTISSVPEQVRTAFDFVAHRTINTTPAGDRLLVHRAKRVLVGGRIIKLDGVHHLFLTMADTSRLKAA
jgi:hypothetical protein